MRGCLFVGLGGAIGSICRYLIGLIPMSSSSEFPIKTLIVNIVGSFFIGLITAAGVKNTNLSPDMILMLKTGICGGFTTFSTFALESATLMQNGKIGYAIAYISASIVFSVVMVFLAEMIVR